MPARVRKIRHDDETRAKIKAANIIYRLYSCVMGKVDLTPPQISAAKILLAKVLPDLQATTISGDKDNPLELVRRVIVEQPVEELPGPNGHDEADARY